MARVKVTIHEDGITALLSQNKGMRDGLVAVANLVQGEAQATASDAEGGPEGRLTGYAAAGFQVEWEGRSGKRPRVNVRSLADPMMALRVHLSTQKRWGIAHLRKALYKYTMRG